MLKILAQHPWRSTLWLVVGFSLLHLLLIGQVELSGDESHYALYGYYLDWSYFDHPPLVGWLNALILPFSDSEFALRLWPVLLSAFSALLLYGMTRDLFPDEPAWLGLVSVAVFESGIMFQLMGMAMLPDTPLIPLSLAAGWVLFRTLQRARVGDWLLLGLLFGLAGLAKYTAVTLVVTAPLAIFWLGRGRLLRTFGSWLAVLVAAIVILPVVIWNYQHEWISFLYQLGHGMPHRAWQVKRFLTSQLGQFIAYSPGIYLFGLIAIVSAFRRPSPGTKLLLTLALPVLLLFGWNGGYETSLPHWPALGWAAMTPLIARWLSHHWSSRGVRLGTYLSALYSTLLILGLAVLILMPWNPFPPNRHPLGDLYGWKQTAEQALHLRDTMAKTDGPTPVLFVGNWSIFSHIAWYARPTPVQVTDQRFDQSDLWYGSPKVGARGIVIVPQYYYGRPQTNGTGKFEHCKQARTIKAMKNHTLVATYFLYICNNYSGK